MSGDAAAARVGVMVPTFNRPDLLRSCVLQLTAQSRPPDLICVHQNGCPDPYHWCIADVLTASDVVWLHTPRKLPQHQWYSIPLQFLIERGCTHFFWTDHDDLYLRDHIERGLEDLCDADFSVSRCSGLLVTKPSDYHYVADVEFTSHAPGGMSSTMCFNRAFALQLLADLAGDTQHPYADNVVAHLTMPKFRCRLSTRRTAIYHSHEGSVSSSVWLAKTFG